MITWFILWARKRARAGGKGRFPIKVVTFGDAFLFRRYCFMWGDESDDKSFRSYRRWIEERYPGPAAVDSAAWTGCGLRRPNALPLWRPFNVLLHWWRPVAGTREAFHDHPRWSVTICLRGSLIERTPWGERMLRAGSIVLRGRRAIHAFEVLEPGRTWTLFIVGRRAARQNTYVVTPQ